MNTTAKLYGMCLFFLVMGLCSCSKESNEEQIAPGAQQNEHAINGYDDTLESNNYKSESSLASKDFTLLKGSLNLDIMLDDFKNKKRSYLMNVSTTAIFNTGRVLPIVGYSLNQYVYWEVGSRGYWRADNRIKRSDSGFSISNHFEVLVYPNPTNPELVDVNQVKLTWRSPELGLQTFHLQNVFVYYVVDGILITGIYFFNDKDTPIGVSISITPKA